MYLYIDICFYPAAAPEVIGQQLYGVTVDWWGLGCLVYEMTAGHAPLRQQGEHPKPPEMERRILKEEPDYGDRFSQEVKDLCCSVRPGGELDQEI